MWTDSGELRLKVWRYRGVWTFCHSWGRDMINLGRKKGVPAMGLEQEVGKREGDYGQSM